MAYPQTGSQYPYPLPYSSYPETRSPYPPTNQPYYGNNEVTTAPAAISGYETNTFETTILPPPSNPQPQQPPSDRQTVRSFSDITEEQAREAAIQFVSENCCYGSGTVKEMIIRDITMTSAFHYKLETFVEKRETMWCSVPYNMGEPLDTPLNGPSPGPWTIPLVPKQQFKNSTQLIEVPHTASAVVCYRCLGSREDKCSKCDGNGCVNCHWCDGRGRRFRDDTCDACKGTGSDRCITCQGNGLETCSICSGTSTLKYYIKLTATWTNHMDDFLSEQTSVPVKLIREVSGHMAFEEQCSRVWPVNHFPEERINQASNNLIQKHSQEFPMERILQQRHAVRIVPVSRVQYSWKDREGDFFVYGLEHKVYFPNYPQSYCCGCTIL